MEKREYQRCTQCVMDTTDSKISFDEHGVCDHCRNFEKSIKPYWKPKENDFEGLEKLAQEIRKAGKGSDYDCILGLSGGADSCVPDIEKETVTRTSFNMLPGSLVANRDLIIQEASRILGRQYVDFSKPEFASKSYKKVGLQVGTHIHLCQWEPANSGFSLFWTDYILHMLILSFLLMNWI